MVVVSFDIDGTLFCGDPAGPVPIEFVHRVRDAGFIFGSASDRTVADQREMWSEIDVEVHFVGHKHQLVNVKNQYSAHTWVHIGDGLADSYHAGVAGFDFWHVDSATEFLALTEIGGVSF